MHPLLSPPRRLVAYLALWLLVALGLAAVLLMVLPAWPSALAGPDRGPNTAPWGAALAFTAPLCLVYAFVALSAYYLCRSQPLAQRRWPAAMAMFGMAALISASAWLAMAWLWNGVGRLAEQGGPLLAMNPQAWSLFFAAGCGLYLLSVLAHDVLLAFEAVRTTTAREAESRVLARDAELRLLRTQIDPHFLFNSLNSISALTTLNPAQAREMAIDLAGFFRRTLALSERERVPLIDELTLCRHFVAIEQRRFGDKLRLHWPDGLQADDSAAAQHPLSPLHAALLPPMILQPLLENAIKHGIRSLDDGGTIELAAVLRPGWLHLSVSNPMADDAPRELGRGLGLGLGLHNIRLRLAVLYGDRARLSTRHQGARFEAELSLPQ